jgi:hypothetical protein
MAKKKAQKRVTKKKTDANDPSSFMDDEQGADAEPQEEGEVNEGQNTILVGDANFNSATIQKSDLPNWQKKGFMTEDKFRPIWERKERMAEKNAAKG